MPKDLKDFYGPTKIKSVGKRIPRNFFQTYKTSLFDDDHADRLIKFRSQNPTFNFYIFDDNDMSNYMARNWGDRKIFEIFNKTLHGASRADIWRYCVLYQYGGIYLDIDSSIQFSLESVPGQISELVSYEDNDLIKFVSPDLTPSYSFFKSLGFRQVHLQHPSKTVMQWLLCFSPYHPILDLAITEIENHYSFFKGKVFDSVHLAVVNYSGPIVYTKAVWKYLQMGGRVTEVGVDFSGLARFKDVESSGIYCQDKQKYSLLRNNMVCF
jgi:mannosyltransferase OCH1-like enzyme